MKVVILITKKISQLFVIQFIWQVKFFKYTFQFFIHRTLIKLDKKTVVVVHCADVYIFLISFVCDKSFCFVQMEVLIIS